MSISNSHKNAVDRRFGEQANAYLTSAVHAQGKDLQRLAQLLEPHAGARLLDLGCGAGHASFTAAAGWRRWWPTICRRKCWRWWSRRRLE